MDIQSSHLFQNLWFYSDVGIRISAGWICVYRKAEVARLGEALFFFVLGPQIVTFEKRNRKNVSKGVHENYGSVPKVAFLSPIVGGHQQPLKRSQITIPKRSRIESPGYWFFMQPRRQLRMGKICDGHGVPMGFFEVPHWVKAAKFVSFCWRMPFALLFLKVDTLIFSKMFQDVKYQLMVNWWFGARWFGFLGSRMKGIVTWGYP